MRQRFLLLFAILAMAINASAYDFEVDGIFYNVTSSSEPYTCEVTYQQYENYVYSSDYTGDINIPSIVTYSGKTFSVTSIGYEAFAQCYSLTSVEIPNSVTSIGNYAFYGCSSLTSVTIPNSVTKIGEYAFSGCKSLTSVEIPNSVTKIGNGAFRACSSLTSVEIPNSVTKIEYYTFYYCSSLTSVEIPNSVTSIGNYAFDGCTSLKEITSLAVTPPSLGYGPFFSVSKEECVLIVPEESVEAYKAAYDWKDFTNIVGITASISTPSANDFRSGKAYNLNGTAANDSFRGIVIKNGKKVLRK